jgi:hypothetical protein
MIDQNISPQLNEDKIQDVYLKKNFQNLNKYFNENNQMLDFKFFDLTFTGEESNRKVEHGLKTVPQDIIVLKVTGEGTVSFNHGGFTDKVIDVSSTGAARIRFLVGFYWKSEKSKNNDAKDSVTEYSARSASLSYVQELEERIYALENPPPEEKIIAYYRSTVNSATPIAFNTPMFSPSPYVQTNPWRFTAPKSGLYLIVVENPIIIVGGGYGSYYVFKNGTVQSPTLFAGTNTVGYSASYRINLDKDDYVHIGVDGSSNPCRVYIERIGDKI